MAQVRAPARAAVAPPAEPPEAPVPAPAQGQCSGCRPQGEGLRIQALTSWLLSISCGCPPFSVSCGRKASAGDIPTAPMKRMKSKNGLSTFGPPKRQRAPRPYETGMPFEMSRLRAITAQEQEPVLQEVLRPAAVPAAGLLPAAVLQLRAVLRRARSDCTQPGTSPLRGLLALVVMSFF